VSRLTLQIITDHESEFYAPNRDADGEADHLFEAFLHEHGIQQTLRAVGGTQSDGKIEHFFQTYDKRYWRFNSREAFLEF
jgi:transposase InsO family protein